MTYILQELVNMIYLLILLTWEDLCSITLSRVHWALKWRFEHLLVFSKWIPAIARSLSQSRLWDGTRVRSSSDISEKIVALSLNCSPKKTILTPTLDSQIFSCSIIHFLWHIFPEFWPRYLYGYSISFNIKIIKTAKSAGPSTNGKDEEATASYLSVKTVRTYLDEASQSCKQNTHSMSYTVWI